MSQSDPRRELDALLAEEPAAARVRALGAYDELAGERGGRVVLFGAGALGRKVLHGLRKLGREPLAFCDSNPAAHGTRIEGVEVCAPAEAAQRFGADAVFLITIWGGRPTDTMPERVERLRALGCRTVIPFGHLFWKHPELFLPHYAMDRPDCVLEARTAILRAFDLWADDASRHEFVAEVRWRLHLDFVGLPRPVAHEIYFPDDLVRPRPDETFMDCGAFDGDTLAAFLRHHGDSFRAAVSFEPDPANFARLGQFHAGLPLSIRNRVRVRQNAVSDRTGMVRFDPTGNESAVMGEGELELDAVALDDLPEAAESTWIKMDIEGAEPLALAGARSVIRRNAPVLAVCAYHRQAHLWEIPLQAAEMSDEYSFHLRPHVLEGWDLVFYAVPRSRLP